jgi:hypothetical protein
MFSHNLIQNELFCHHIRRTKNLLFPLSENQNNLLRCFNISYVLAIVAGKGTPGVGPDPFGEVFRGTKIDSLHSILPGDQNR